MVKFSSNVAALFILSHVISGSYCQLRNVRTHRGGESLDIDHRHDQSTTSRLSVAVLGGSFGWSPLSRACSGEPFPTLEVSRCRLRTVGVCGLAGPRRGSLHYSCRL